MCFCAVMCVLACNSLNKSNGSPRFWWVVIIVWGDCIHFFFHLPASICNFQTKITMPWFFVYIYIDYFLENGVCVCINGKCQLIESINNFDFFMRIQSWFLFCLIAHCIR